MGKNYYVQIIEYDTETVVKEIGPMSERQVDKVENGVNINLNHQKYYTLVQHKEGE